MNILIVSAAEVEISPLLGFLKMKFSDSGKLQKCVYKNINIDVLITGIGMSVTAFHLGKILSGKYNAALNFGIAGSFNLDLEIGSVVNITQDHFAELGAEDGNNFLSLKEIGLNGISEVINESLINNEVLDMIPKVCGITVNKIHGNEENIETVFQRFHPNTESMEGAAFLMACAEEKIPCAQVRAVSNFVERRNKGAWDISLAVENLNAKAVEILNAF